MQTFQIEVKETLSKTVEILADSPEEAIELVKNQYENEQFVLGAENYLETDFYLIL